MQKAQCGSPTACSSQMPLVSHRGSSARSQSEFSSRGLPSLRVIPYSFSKLYSLRAGFKKGASSRLPAPPRG
jgi:hypothetical protein